MSKRLLIVDDEITILMAFKKLFEGTEMTVDIANNKEDAFKLLSIHSYDVVVTDLRLTNDLPEAGLDIIRFVKDYHPRTRTILITAYGNEEIRRKTSELSGTIYLEKPVSGILLKETLKQLGI